MDWARGFFAAPGRPLPAVEPEPEALIDTPFAARDGRLSELWRAYYESTTAADAAQRESNLDALVGTWLEAYRDWHPERGGGGGGGGGGGADGGGAVAGHPVLVLGGLGCNFKTAVHVVCEAVTRPYDGSPRTLPRRELLDLLCVLSRSGPNRLALLRWDVHTSAVRLLKVLCTHLKDLAGSVGAQRRWAWSDVEGWWTELEAWLEVTLHMVLNFVDPSRRWLSRYGDGGATDSPAPRPGGGSADARRPTPSDLATTSVVKGVLPALVDSLAALREVMLQAPFCRERHALLDVVLTLVGGALCCQPARLDSVVALAVGVDAVRAVLDLMGWPAHQQQQQQGVASPLPPLPGITAQHPAESRTNDLVSCTYSSQLLLLRVLCELLHELLNFHNANSDTLMRDAHNKVVETMLWVCASFWDRDRADLSLGKGSTEAPQVIPEEALQMIPVPPPPRSGGATTTEVSVPVSVMVSARTELELPPCQPVQTFFQMLGAICVVTRRSANALNPKAVSLFFDLASRGVQVSEPAAEAREYFLCCCPVIQLYSIQALIQLCDAQPAAVLTLRSAGLLSKAFNAGFYFPTAEISAQPQQQSQQSQQSQQQQQLFTQLQFAVMELVRGMATSDCPKDQATNLYECDLLLKLAREHSSTTLAVGTCLVADATECLAWMIEAAPVMTRQSFTALGAVNELCDLVLEQKPIAEDLMDGENVALRARLQVFRLCEIFLGADMGRLQALCQPDMGLIDAFFSLLSRPDCREFAVECIAGCMLPRPNSDEAHAAKTQLFSRFTTQFSGIIAGQSEQPLQLVSLMLKGVLRVIGVSERATRMSHQDMFREAMCFLHIVTFWNTWEYGKSDSEMAELTVTLVHTLTGLIDGNDENKSFFSETIGYDQLQELLLRPGQGSDSLLTSVYSMMFDGEVGIAEPSKIQNADCVAMYVKLLYTREAKFATTKAAQLLTMLNRFSTNIQSCCDVGLLDLLVEKLPDIADAELQSATLRLIEVLGGHSITAKQLRSFLSLMTKAEGQESEAESDGRGRPSYASLLLETMHGMYVEAGAGNFFDFDGKDSGLQVCDKVDRWPQRGYSFSLWVKVETFDCQIASQRLYEPRLFSFLTKDGRGIEAFLREGSVVLQVRRAQSIDEATMNKSGFPLRLDTGRWYHIAIVHRAARTLGQPEVCFFIDGQQSSPASVLRYPDVTGGMEGYIGTNAVQSVASAEGAHQMIPAMPLCGQMASLYFFDTALQPPQLQAVHSLGPNYMFSFEATDDSTMASETGDITVEQQSLLASGLSAQIWLSYNAKACDEGMAFDTTPESIGRTAGLNARLLGPTSASGTRSCVTRKLRDTMSAMGGVKLMFPLFTHLARLCRGAGQSEHDETSGHHTEAQRFLINLFILFQRALTNPNNVNFMAQSNGFGAIQYLLRHAPPESFCAETLKSISDLGNSLLDNKLQSLSHRYILLDFQTWIYTATPVQTEAIRQLQRIRDANPPMFQELCGVQGLLDILRKYYWFVPGDDSQTAASSLGGAQASARAKRPPPEDIRSLRWQLLDILQAHMQQHYTDEDFDCIMAFLCSAEDGDQLCDVVTAVRALCQVQPRAYRALIVPDNLALVTTLLQHTSESVLRETIMLLASLVVFEDIDQDQRAQLREVVLSVSSRAVTSDVKQALLRAALGSPDACVNDPRETDEIKNPAFMIVLLDAHLQCLHALAATQDAEAEASGWVDYAALLEAIMSYFGASMQSCVRFCSMDGWQEVCISALTMDGCPAEIQESLCQMFRTIHLHSFRYCSRGWQTLASSLAQLESVETGCNEWLTLRRRLCTDTLESVHRVVESGVWKPEMRDSISHLMLLTEDIMFPHRASGLTDAVDAPVVVHESGSEETSWPNLRLAEAAWSILERNDLRFTDFADDDAGLLLRHPGGLARISIRILVACIIEGIQSKSLGQYLLRLHQYLGSLPPSTDQTNAIHVYSLAKLAQGGSDTRFVDDAGRRLALARILQQFVRFFEPVLEHSLPDPRICRATLADDEYKRANLPQHEYDEYVPRAYLSVEWAAQLDRCTCLEAERECTFKTTESFAGFSDEGLAEYRQQANTSASSIAADEAMRSSLEIQLEQTNVRGTKRAWTWIRRGLTHEGSPWGHVEDGEDQQFWKLDRVEGTQRKRMLLKRNYKGTRHEDAIYTKHKTKGKRAAETADLTLKLKQTAPEILIDDGYESLDDDGGGSQAGSEVQGNSVDGTSNATPEISGSKESAVEEKLVHTAEEAFLIKPMATISGRFEITTTHLYFKPDALDGDASVSPGVKHHKERKWALRNVAQVHPRRYLLRKTAIEVFKDDTTSHFIDFKSTDACDDVIKKLLALRQRNLVIVTRRTKARMLKEATSKWKDRKVSNFEYIMFLNTISGRSYNDISQYPVFPWVLTDFTSSTIDLHDKSVYRDLSKPVGALDPDRLEYLVERSRALEETDMGPDADMPVTLLQAGALYGSHYSSPGTTLFYLLRMEPFTTLAIKLQGDHFDVADRMFHSIPSAWNGVLKGTQDFKELVPEFFYLPEFLYNSNGFDLGTTQKGETLGDVILPPWAATAEEFVRINRLALESEFVSQDLHLWVDLIFGSKQSGDGAKEANNLFHHLTYEANVLRVDFDATDSEAIDDMIKEFGQTPAQLFTKSHVKRTDDEPTDPAEDGSTGELVASFNADARRNPLVYVHAYDEFIVTLSSGRRVGHHRWMPFPNFQGAPFTFELDRNAGSRTRIGVEFTRGFDMMQPCFAVTPDGKSLFSCGHWDGTFKCSHIDSGRVLQSVGQHKDVVTSLALGEDGATLVTGSLDGTVMIWDIDISPAATQPVSSSPRAVLYGHRDEITCIDINTGLGIVASASKDGSCLIHKTYNGQYVRCIKNPKIAKDQAQLSFPAAGDSASTAHGGGASDFAFGKVLVSQSEGTIVLYSSNDLMLYLFSVNGKLLYEVDAMERLHAWTLTPDGECLITGSERMIVKLRCMDDLQTIHTFERVEAPICSLALTPEDNILLVGLDDGRLTMLGCAARRLLDRHRRRVRSSGGAQPEPELEGS